MIWAPSLESRYTEGLPQRGARTLGFVVYEIAPWTYEVAIMTDLPSLAGIVSRQNGSPRVTGFIAWISYRMTFTALEKPTSRLSLRRSIRRPVFANNSDAVLIRILRQAPTSESWPLPDHYTQENCGEEAEEGHHSKEPNPAIQWVGDQYQGDTHQPAPATLSQGRMKNGKARDRICR